MKSVLLFIIAGIITNYPVLKTCESVIDKALKEHTLLFQQIENGDAEAAKLTMIEHLKGLMELAQKVAR